MHMGAPDVCWVLVLLSKKLLRLPKASFDLLLLLYGHVAKATWVRPLGILLLHPLHMLLLSHFLLLS